MNPSAKTTPLKAPALALILLLTPLAALFAVNDTPGSPACGPTPGCVPCGAPNPGGLEICQSTSFNFTLNLGYARMNRTANLLTQGKQALLEGQGAKGYQRDFDELLRDYFDTSNTTNRTMEKLLISRPTISAALYDPGALEYTVSTGAVYLTDPQTKHLRQVLTEGTFTNITLLADGYAISTWDISQMPGTVKAPDGFYPLPAGDPISRITFRNPDHPAASGRLLLAKKENPSGSATIETAEIYDQSNPDMETVDLYEGSEEQVLNLYKGLASTAKPLQKTTLTFTRPANARPWDYTFLRVIGQASNTNGILGPLAEVSRVSETHRDFSLPLTGPGGEKNGKRIMSRTEAPGTPDAQTTTYEYYETPENKNTHGRLKSLQGPGGKWEYWEYTGDENSSTLVETKYSPWQDTTLANHQQGIREETVITSSGATRTTTIAGQVIARRIFESIKDPATGNITFSEKTWDGSQPEANAWATETTVFSSHKGPDSGRPLHTTHPDGTVSLHQYSANGPEVTVATLRGEGTPSAVTRGTKTAATYNRMNEVTMLATWDIESGRPLTLKAGEEFDSIGRAQKWIYNGDVNDYEIAQYSCCGLAFSRDRTGATATYSRDALKRVYRVITKSSSTATPITTLTIHNGLTTTTTSSDGTTTLLASETTSSPGGLTTTTKSPDADGDGLPETTTTVSDPASRTRTTTHPDGTTSSSQSFPDGSLKSSTDQLGHTTTYTRDTHALNGGGILRQTTAANGTQWQKSYSDPLGRTFRTEFPDTAASTVTYHPFTAAPGSRGKTASSTDPDGITVTYAYNAEGEQTTTTSPLPNGQQSITVTEQDVVSDTFTGIAYRTRSTVNGLLISTSLSGTYGYRSKSIDNLTGNISTSIRTVPNDGAWTVTSTSPDGTYSVSTTTNGLTVKQEAFGSDDILIMSSQMTYDAFDRVLTQTDSRTGTTTMGTYLENGSPTSVTAPGGRTTAFTYDKMGRRLTVDAPDTLDAEGNTLANITYTSYNDDGQVAATWGAQTNPTFRIYDSLHRMSELRTYQSLASGTQPTAATPGFAKTTWLYSPARGFLTGKRDAADKGADYTYTPAGRLATRKWGRSSVALPLITAYTYAAGLLTTTGYSDTTPGVTITYDNFGRPLTQSNTLATTTYSYDPTTLALDTETIAYDLDQNGTPELTRTLDRKQDSLLRPTGWQLKNGTTVESEATYTYSPTDGRLATVSDATDTFSYSYLPNSNLLSSITGPAHTVANTWENDRNVLLNKINHTGTPSSPISRFDYALATAPTDGANAIGQRVDLVTTGSAFASSRDTSWGYDPLGQVTKADSTIPGLDRAYQYDMIGNRVKSADSLTLPTANNYTPNALNQYTLAEGVTLPTPAYDTDGNYRNGPLPVATGNATLEWDAENRLVKVTRADSTVILYDYDFMGRRISKKVGSGTAERYIYDGWNPIAEYSGATLEETYTWGMDLSGSMQGAGGVGGLLAVTSHSALGTSHFFPTYDGNGNVSEYLDSNGAVVAHYEYDPFGKITVATGSKAQDFAHRFSTKPLDSETGLYYYGYRYYDPATGRWPSRDPIGERGGVNLYGFVGNDGVNQWDYLGMAPSRAQVENGTRRAQELLDQINDCYESNSAGCDPDPCQGLYDQYLSLLSQLTGDAGEFYEDQWWVSDADQNAFNNVYGLPTTVDGAAISREQLAAQIAAANAAGESIGNNLFNEYGSEIENGANFAGGFSDGVLFGQGHNLARLAYGSETPWVDTSSGYYTGGMVTGIAATTAAYGFAGLPANMTHFTTAAGARGIAASGGINATRLGLFGPGTYMATIGRPLNLFVPRASTVAINLARPSGTVRIIPGLVYLRPFRGVRF